MVNAGALEVARWVYIRQPAGRTKLPGALEVGAWLVAATLASLLGRPFPVGPARVGLTATVGAAVGLVDGGSSLAKALTASTTSRTTTTSRTAPPMPAWA